MPKTTANFKCEKCGDEFTATSECFTSCKCGECTVKPNAHSTAYQGKINFQRLRSKTYYYEDDRYIMKDEVLDLFNECKTLAKEIGFNLYETYVEDEAGNKFLEYLDYTFYEVMKNNVEINEIKFHKLDFEKVGFDEEKWTKRLSKFKEVLLKIKSKELDLTKRKELKENELDLYWESEQVKYYDYTFYV